MAAMRIDPSLIERQARELQRLELEPGRAEELAAELLNLLEAAAAAGEQAQFEDDPADFPATLVRLREREDAASGSQDPPTAPQGAGARG